MLLESFLVDGVETGHRGFQEERGPRVNVGGFDEETDQPGVSLAGKNRPTPRGLFAMGVLFFISKNFPSTFENAPARSSANKSSTRLLGHSQRISQYVCLIGEPARFRPSRLRKEKYAYFVEILRPPRTTGTTTQCGWPWFLTPSGDWWWRWL